MVHMTWREKATERKLQGAKVPGNERAGERVGQGASWPGSESARVLLAYSHRGANWPGSEKARYRSLYWRNSTRNPQFFLI